jgi:mannose-6-phosphate isomerase
MNKFEPVKFTPIAVPRIWGGHTLKSWFDTDTDQPIGEYWVVSSHPHGTSVVEQGAFKGKTLNDLVREHPEAYLGDSPQPRFPLLIKFIEAAQDLSVQVHPDDEYARRVESDFGKTEAWYVLDCPDDGRVIYGHQFKSRQEYMQAVEEKRVKPYLEYVPISPGRLVFVPSRTLHALLAGTMVLEIQQTSDVTYRVYDWDRVDEHGRSRELHVEKAADVLEYGSQPNPFPAAQEIPAAAGMRGSRMASCPYFTIDKWNLLSGRHSFVHGRRGNPDIVIVTEGQGTLHWPDGDMPLRRGDAVIVPATLSGYTVFCVGGMELIRVFY